MSYYSDSDTLELKFQYVGDNYLETDGNDNLSVKIIQNKTKNIAYSCENDNSTIVFTL